ncbi:anhydro-N-acetylmuramic acid kinase [Acetobacter fallax]|uniref:Anhydro-N-acetylmuramic acid kinase n=1 Tax=Acetobacter fallax TaxID=1737473 RepID=A0ABX0K7Z4_9PROT|nr:anhydro-N-acetylmuramic acid kinase [Acetobacter fallax]NHO32515.1 anhydro-N-acetylmuramic acid kinase [Acetobacter fallax]NHO36141.1 anhydro-N-acetylmuramic acid kinase [Acetobacter fallax]
MQSVIGLMSGTSLDGVDAAWIETDGERIGWQGPSLTLPYSPELRKRLRALLDRAPTLFASDPDLLDAVQALTLRHAEAVQALREKVEVVRPESRLDIIGFHGQTILHDPTHGRTWQIGDAALLAEKTETPVVYDFRSADVAAGGQGAPLVPVYHVALAADVARPVALLNLGGVGNVTFIGASGSILACDTGPGNALIDDWVLRHTGIPCDIDGQLAKAGVIDVPVLNGLLDDPFFTQAAPKSLDRQHFHAALDALAGLSVEDGAATLTAFTAASVASLSLPEKPGRWIVCGGGRHNPVLMRVLAERLNAPVESAERHGWDGDAMEAQCFGFLAIRSVKGLPLSFPGTTGVPYPVSGGITIQPVRRT